MLTSQKLQKRVRALKPIVVMHDFFIDRIVRLKDPDLDRLFSAANSKIKAGGGSIRGVEQEEVKGGNAVNLAYALSRLGASTGLITAADELGSAIIMKTFSPFRNSKLFISRGRPGYTVSLEVVRKKVRTNVMVSDVGDAADFGPSRLGKRELRMIKDASAVVVVNWASNLRGTELALKVFKSAGRGALCFLDPADFSRRREEFVRCLASLSQTLDVLSINENECRILIESLGMKPLPLNYSVEEIGDAAKELAEELSLTVDLHTPLGAATSVGRETSFVQSFDLDDVKVATGAGDVWDAADIIGYLCKMNPSERLIFANASAALYISSASMDAPRLGEVTRFFSKH